MVRLSWDVRGRKGRGTQRGKGHKERVSEEHEKCTEQCTAFTTGSTSVEPDSTGMSMFLVGIWQLALHRGPCDVSHRFNSNALSGVVLGSSLLGI